MEKRLFCVEWNGNMTIVQASSAESARRGVRRDYGATNDPYAAREATEDDIAWFKSWNGAIRIEA